MKTEPAGITVFPIAVEFPDRLNREPAGSSIMTTVALFPVTIVLVRFQTDAVPVGDDIDVVATFTETSVEETCTAVEVALVTIPLWKADDCGRVEVALGASGAKVLETTA